MGLLSIFQRKKQAAATPAKPGRGARAPLRQPPLASAPHPAESADAVREARARARRRLMGATVLLLVGVIGFPLLFETQPRPIPVDLPIDIPSRNAVGAAEAPVHVDRRAAALAAALAPAPGASVAMPESVSYDDHGASAPSTAPSAAEPAHKSAFATLASAFTSSPQRAADVRTPAALQPASASDAAPAPSRAVARPPVKVAVTPPHIVLPPPVETPAAAPAALLAGDPAAKPSDAAPGAARFVVQIGAFADDGKARDARGKVEKIGMKTYTQSVDTPAGKRVRVRVGPYATKADADKAAVRIKADGLPAAVLVL